MYFGLFLISLFLRNDSVCGNLTLILFEKNVIAVVVTIKQEIPFSEFENNCVYILFVECV